MNICKYASKLILTAVVSLMISSVAKAEKVQVEKAQAEGLQIDCPSKLYKFKGDPLPMNTFYIEKNDNANTVFYDINLKDGEIDSEQPLDVYWIMYAKKGQKEGLTRMERKLAFGVNSVRQIVAGKKYAARIASMDRDITISYVDGCAQVDTVISGKSARLERLKLQLKGPSFFATLIYMDIYGRDHGTGDPIVERWYYK